MGDGSWRALLAVFAPLSLLSIGGGQSVIPEMHRQVVEVHHWLTESQFVADYAISRMAPGPGSMIVTLIGWQVAGWLGAVVATVGIFLPSSVVVWSVARLWARHRGAPWQRAVEQGLAPIAAGLILAASLTLVRALPGGWLAWAATAASTVVVLTTRISPLWLLAAGAALFLLAGAAIPWAAGTVLP